ncbi:hypothetical protein J4T99_gp108 [Mycobacterium phage Bromden]|uniref:Uncharacterized protein n=1 Tax=Mycobacterium phage Bromden TaxID=2283252 RepID=A0A345MBP1_9CAUD|nr:hypothetical protein J4T99_gp108 [Mycobacterium phage Bromden]AXH67912.1 hypothetical protein SEA_BROMDEN_108 [Mycobacterium phage Bromden]
MAFDEAAYDQAVHDFAEQNGYLPVLTAINALSAFTAQYLADHVND